jgi:hypothetical protein
MIVTVNTGNTYIAGQERLWQHNNAAAKTSSGMTHFALKCNKTNYACLPAAQQVYVLQHNKKTNFQTLAQAYAPKLHKPVQTPEWLKKARSADWPQSAAHDVVESARCSLPRTDAL